MTDQRTWTRMHQVTDAVLPHEPAFRMNMKSMISALRKFTTTDPRPDAAGSVHMGGKENCYLNLGYAALMLKISWVPDVRMPVDFLRALEALLRDAVAYEPSQEKYLLPADQLAALTDLHTTVETILANRRGGEHR